MAGLLPVPNPSVSFWGKYQHGLADHRSTHDLPARVDVAVIGAGYAGVSTVHHILDSCAKRGVSPPSILLLEARKACSGATGRNGGHLKPDPCNRPASLAVTHGVDIAVEAAEFEARNLAAVKRLVEDEKIECDFVYTRAVDALMSDGVVRKMRAGVEMLRAKGVSVMKDVHFVEGPDAEKLSGVKGAKGCITYSAAHLFPPKLILALLAKALASGHVNLQTHTPVTHVSKTADDADGCVAITTKSRGEVRARTVVHATNGYASALLPEFAEKIIPARGVCSRVVVPRQHNHRDEAKGVVEVPPALKTSYMIRWSDTNYEYLVPRLDGSIVVGGARSRFYHDLPSWYGNARDDEAVISPRAREYFDWFMQRVFHGWEGSGARVDDIWTGVMGYTSDAMPFIGRIPTRANQLILAGFNGHGMPQVFLAARGVASLVLDSQLGFGGTGVPGLYEVTRERMESGGNLVLEGWRRAHTQDGDGGGGGQEGKDGKDGVRARL